MSDFSSHGMRRHVPLRTHVVDSVRPLLHLWRLLVQAAMRNGDRSLEAKLRGGGHVSLAHGFRLDGTTFVINQMDGTSTRVPASNIERIVDRGDYGYT